MNNDQWNTAEVRLGQFSGPRLKKNKTTTTAKWQYPLSVSWNLLMKLSHHFLRKVK